MATQSGTLKAGYQLYIDIQNGDSSTVFDYTVTGASVRDNGKAWKSDRVLGPFVEDVNYTVTYTGSPSIYSVRQNGQREYTVETLPDPATLMAGEAIVVTAPYGENVAVVVNGAFRYLMPFKTTWEGRPPVSSVPVGTELQVTDYANQKWICDGTYWRPAQGRVIIKSLFGLVAAGGQIAQLSGTNAGLFTIPGGCKIPSGMIIPQSRLYVQADGYKTGANGTANFIIQLGTSNSSSDAVACSQGMSIGTGINAIASCAARFGTATDRFNSRNWQGEGVSSASNNSMSDRVGNVNTLADMYVNVGISVANTSDVFNLVSLQVVLES